MVEGAADPTDEQLFVPEVVNIKSGDTVKWIDNDSAPHTATAGTLDTGPSGQFDSGIWVPVLHENIHLMKQEKYRIIVHFIHGC